MVFNSLSFLKNFTLVVLFVSNFVYSQNNNSKEHLPYYGKVFNNMIRSQVAPNSAARARFIQTINPEVLRNEMFRVLSLNHIEKADQGFDAIVNSCTAAAQTNCYKHDKNDYTYSREIVYNDLDKQQANRAVPADYVVDVYCQQVYKFPGGRTNLSHNRNTSSNGTFQNSRSSNPGPLVASNNFLDGVQPIGDINIEHTWPQSRFSKQFSKELQKGDLHHLFPSNAKINQIRGNHPFGEVEQEDNGVANCPSVLGFDKEGDQVFEPVDSHKGNVARALFYFSVRYQIAISPSEEAALRAWHKLDPIDETEIERNNKIFSIQKNRNPFIDFPELVAAINDF